MALYGHIWSAELSVASLSLYDGLFTVHDLEVIALGKQIGTTVGQTSNMTWTANVSGSLAVNWDAETVTLPLSLRSMSLAITLAASLDVTAGELISLDLNVVADVSIGDAGDGFPVFALTVETIIQYPMLEPAVCTATGSLNLGPLSVEKFSAIMTLFPDPIKVGSPKFTMTGKLKDIMIGAVDMGTVVFSANAYQRTVDNITSWYVTGTMSSKVGFDEVTASALGIAPVDIARAQAQSAATLGGTASLGGVVTFNSDTLAWSVTSQVTYETDYFTAVILGTFNSECTDEGTTLTGTLKVTADIPVPLPDITVTAVKHCQLWQREVISIRAEIDSDAWREAKDATTDNAATTAAVGGQHRPSSDQPSYHTEKQPGKSPSAALGLTTALSFGVENMVISLIGYHVDANRSDLMQLSWVFKIAGSISLTSTSNSPVPTGVASVDVKLIWAFAPRGSVMQKYLIARPLNLSSDCAELVAVGDTATGRSCARKTQVCGPGLACVSNVCVDIAAIEDTTKRAASAATAVALQSYGYGLACAVSGDAVSGPPSVELNGSMTISNEDWLTITGSFHAVIPCQEDDYASAEVRISLDKFGIKIVDLAVGMMLYCAAAAADGKKFKIYGSLDNIEIGSFSMGGVYVDVVAYHESANVTGSNQYWVGTITGSIAITEGLDVTVSASYSTKPSSSGLTVAINATYVRTFSKGVELNLAANGSLTIPCNTLGDLYISGMASVTGLNLQVRPLPPLTPVHFLWYSDI